MKKQRKANMIRWWAKSRRKLGNSMLISTSTLNSTIVSLTSSISSLRVRYSWPINLYSRKNSGNRSILSWTNTRRLLIESNSSKYMENQISVSKSMCHQSSSNRQENKRKSKKRIVTRKCRSLTIKCLRSPKNWLIMQVEGKLLLMAIETSCSIITSGIYSTNSRLNLVPILLIKNNITHIFG